MNRETVNIEELGTCETCHWCKIIENSFYKDSPLGECMFNAPVAVVDGDGNEINRPRIFMTGYCSKYAHNKEIRDAITAKKQKVCQCCHGDKHIAVGKPGNYSKCPACNGTGVSICA